MILRAVARREMLLGASRGLAKVAAALAVAVYLLSLNGFYGALFWIPAHAAAIAVGRRDPDLLDVMAAERRCKRRRALDAEPGSWYAGGG